MLDHLLQSALEFAVLSEGPLDIRPILLANLLDSLVDKLVLNSSEDLDQRPVCPLEHELAAVIDIAPQDVLIKDKVVELFRRGVSHFVREFTALGFDDDRLAWLHAINLRVLATRQLSVNALLVLPQ